MTEVFANAGVAWGVQFSLSSGIWVQGTHYTVTGLPAGLSASIAAQSNTGATLSICD